MSTKLSNGTEYMNPNFPADFGEFLIANNFTTQANKSTLRFRSADKFIDIRNDQVELYLYHPEIEGTENDKCVFEQSHIGISHFNLFGWIFLMHVMGVLKISDFISNSKRAGVQTSTEASFILDAALKGPLQNVTA